MIDEFAYNPQPTASDLAADKVFEKSMQDGCKVTFYDAAGAVITPDDTAFYAKRARCEVTAPEEKNDEKRDAKPFKIERVEKDAAGNIVSQGEVTPKEMAAELPDVVTITEKDGRETMNLNLPEVLVCAVCKYQGNPADFQRVAPGPLGLRCLNCWNEEQKTTGVPAAPRMIADEIGKEPEHVDESLHLLAIPWPQETPIVNTVENLKRIAETYEEKNGEGVPADPSDLDACGAGSGAAE